MWIFLADVAERFRQAIFDYCVGIFVFGADGEFLFRQCIQCFDDGIEFCRRQYPDLRKPPGMGTGCLYIVRQKERIPPVVLSNGESHHLVFECFGCVRFFPEWGGRWVYHGSK